jgi:hypothetical protein
MMIFQRQIKYFSKDWMVIPGSLSKNAPASTDYDVALAAIAILSICLPVSFAESLGWLLSPWALDRFPRDTMWDGLP